MKFGTSSRRDFLKGTAGAVALFNVVPRYVIAGSGQTPPSERIRVAAIGAAGRAVSDIYGLADNGAEIVGLCDVDTRRVGKTRERFKSTPFFTYYKEMLDKLDNQIDAVMIGVPDHWHATMAVECLKRGKHVECEKPLAQCYSEVDGMIKVAKASGKVNQAMNQGHAYNSLRDFREWIEAGLIGKVSEVQFWAPAVYSFMDRLGELKNNDPIPPELNWEQWQGPVAPHRAYSKLYLPGSWRFWADYGCSTLGDWACHLMDPIYWTFGLDMPSAVTAEIVGDWKPGIHGATFPKGVKTTFEFPVKGRDPLKVVWYDGEAAKTIAPPPGYGTDLSKFPPTTRKGGFGGDGCCEGGFVFGDKGVIQYGSHGACGCTILGKMDELKAANAFPAQKYRRVPNGSPYREFIDAVKGGAPVGSDFEYAGRITKAALIAVAALFDAGKRLEWDAAAGQFKNSDAANKRLHRDRLAGY